MNALIPGAPLRSLSPTSIEYQRAQGASRAAKPARVARFTLDAPEHSGTIPGAIGDILPPGVALTSNLAVIFTLNQYSRTDRRRNSRYHNRWNEGAPGYMAGLDGELSGVHRDVAGPSRARIADR